MVETTAEPRETRRLVDEFDDLRDRLEGITHLLWFFAHSTELAYPESRALRAIQDQVELLHNHYQDANESLARHLGFDTDAQGSRVRDMQDQAAKAMRR